MCVSIDKTASRPEHRRDRLARPLFTEFEVRHGHVPHGCTLAVARDDVEENRRRRGPQRGRLRRRARPRLRRSPRIPRSRSRASDTVWSESSCRVLPRPRGPSPMPPRSFRHVVGVGAGSGTSSRALATPRGSCVSSRTMWLCTSFGSHVDGDADRSSSRAPKAERGAVETSPRLFGGLSSWQIAGVPDAWCRTEREPSASSAVASP